MGWDGVPGMQGGVSVYDAFLVGLAGGVGYSGFLLIIGIWLYFLEVFFLSAFACSFWFVGFFVLCS